MVADRGHVVVDDLGDVQHVLAQGVEMRRLVIRGNDRDDEAGEPGEHRGMGELDRLKLGTGAGPR
jgi:hypothetical protein